MICNFTLFLGTKMLHIIMWSSCENGELHGPTDIHVTCTYIFVQLRTAFNFGPCSSCMWLLINDVMYDFLFSFFFFLEGGVLSEPCWWYKLFLFYVSTFMLVGANNNNNNNNNVTCTSGLETFKFPIFFLIIFRHRIQSFEFKIKFNTVVSLNLTRNLKYWLWN